MRKIKKIFAGHLEGKFPEEETQEVKKDVGTLSNSLSGATKQGDIYAQDDKKLQIERSASLLADTRLPGSYDPFHPQIQKFYKKWGFNYLR